jgi:hypothetical protein
MSGDDARIKEGWSLLERGRARLEQGFTQADKDALNRQERAKRKAVWEFMKALEPLKDGYYLDTERLDVVDVTEPEIMQLVNATQATCADDLKAVANVVSRLRLDGFVPDMATFEALVLRREIAPPPPKVDFQEVLRALKAAEEKLIRSGQIKRNARLK